MTWAAVALFVSTLGCIGTAAADPYPMVLSTTPADGAWIDVAPSEVAVTFSKDIGPDVFFLTIDGPGILRQPRGQVTRSGPTMSRPFVTSPVSSPQAPADRYEVRYEAVLDRWGPYFWQLLLPHSTACAGAMGSINVPEPRIDALAGVI